YTAVALTLAYSLSGLAVNHVEDWNPNYSFEETPVDVGPLPATSYEAMETHVVQRLAIDPAQVKGRFMETETEFRVFLPEGQEVRVDVRDGKGLYKSISTHPVIYEVNALHLNNIRGLWTWVADLFAVSLITLALTGLFMIKGRRGLGGRGKWFVGAGLLVPVGFILYMYYGA
ncbi:MAG: PepSY-associated TM helix domain-containing protein, partial [Nannocystaceae bacterium]